MLGDNIESQRMLLRKVKEVAKVMKDEGLPDEMLDDLVQQASSEAASEVSNSGATAQIEYLLRASWSVADILFKVREQQEDVGEEM